MSLDLFTFNPSVFRRTEAQKNISSSRHCDCAQCLHPAELEVGWASNLVLKTVLRAGSQAVLRIWERDECVLHAIGEDTVGLLGPVCWQPNGRHIYAAQEVEGQQGVVLFERNGLSHGNSVTSSQEQESGEIWFLQLSLAL